MTPLSCDLKPLLQAKMMACFSSGVLVTSTLEWAPSRGLQLATLLLAVVGTTAQADDDFAPITPYRPSVSSPAQLPAPGQLEFELGGLHQTADGSRRDSLPYLFKLAYDKNWGLLIGGEALVRLHDDSGRASGLGDTTLTLKRAWNVEEGTAFGLELGVKLPTAKDTIGNGKTDFSLNAIYSHDFGPVHMDANLNGLRLGISDPGTSRNQYGASAAFSTPIAEHWGLTGELSGTQRSGVEHGRQLLAAVTYSPTPLLTFDLGAARAIAPHPATTSLFAGMVVPLAKFW